MVASGTGGATVLLVEDETAVAEIYRIGLEAAGYRVETAADGRAALERVAERRPDILVLDLRLPRMDGFEVLIALRAQLGLADVPVLLLSNLADRPTVERGLSLGARDFLVKMHTTPAALCREVSHWLGQCASVPRP